MIDQNTNYMAFAGLKRNGVGPTFYKKDEVDFIKKTVCEWFGIEESVLNGKTRRREVVLPRQIIMTLLAKHASLKLKMIGRMYGKDHTTVVHARRAVMNLYQTDEKFRETFDLLERKIQ